MKVLHVLPDLSAGGAEGFVTNLGVSLARLGAQVRFLLMAGARDARGQVLLSRLRDADIEVVGSEVHNVRSPINLFRLMRLVANWRPDIVQANLYTAEVLVAAAKLMLVGDGPCYVRRLANSSIASNRSHTIVRLMDRAFSDTVACSSTVENAYRLFMQGQHKSKLVTIRNGGLLRQSIPTTIEKLGARHAFQIPGKAFVVAHIGGMRTAFGHLESAEKAHDVLLTSYATALGGQTDCFLLLVGDGPLRATLETLARDLRIATQVRFLGHQPEPWQALEAADVFCFPSRHEGMPNVLPEAASCGLPVLASDIPEIRSLYPGPAWLLKPVDAVDAFAEGLRNMKANLCHFKSHALSIVPSILEEYSMAACARRYLDAYEAALERAGQRN